MEFEYIRITPEPGKPDFPALFRRRELIWLLAKKELLIRYKQTVLGPAWLVLQPILNALVYALVFDGLAGLGTGGAPKMGFYLSGAAVWGFFAGCFVKNALCFRENAALFGKVYFPRLAVPAANLLCGLVTLGVQFVPVLPFLRPSHFWALPLGIGLLGTLGIGLGLAVSALTVRYRDLHVLVQFGLQLWMYASPIAYPLDAVGKWASRLLLNPVTAPVELIRYCLFGTGTVTAAALAWSAFCGFAALWLGIRLFTGAEATFLDTV